MAEELNDCQGEGPEFIERTQIKKPSDQLRDAWQDGPYGSVVLYAADLLDEQAKTISILRDDLAELSRLRYELEEAREIIGRFLRYFGQPVGVNLQELGRDAYVEHTVIRLRIGDLMDARAFLNREKADG